VRTTPKVAPKVLGWATVKEILRIGDFRYLITSTVLLVFAFEMRAIAQSWLAFELTDSQAWVGIVNGIPAMAVIALSLAGGIVADRFPKRDILIWVRVALAVLSFAVGYLVVSGRIEVWHLVVFALVQGSIVAFGMPASTAIIYEMVGRRRLLTAVSLRQSLSSLGVIAGPAIGGALVGLLGVGPVYVVVGGIYVGSVVFTLFIRTREVAGDGRSRSAFQDIVAGIRYVRGHSLVRTLLLLNLMVLFGGFVMPLVPLYARDILGVGDTGFGALMTAMGAGAIVGSLGLASLGNVRRKILLLIAAPLVWAVGMVAFGYSRHFWLSMVTMFFMGTAGPIYDTTIVTMVQSVIPDSYRGRVTSLFNITMQLYPVGWMLGGALAVVAGNETTLVIGAAVVASVPLLAFGLSRELRNASV
jgi:MFS family permease